MRWRVLELCSQELAEGVHIWGVRSSSGIYFAKVSPKCGTHLLSPENLRKALDAELLKYDKIDVFRQLDLFLSKVRRPHVQNVRTETAQHWIAVSNQNHYTSPAPFATGIDGFISDVSRRAAASPHGTVRFILDISADYAYIHLHDAWNPLRFLSQMASAPPVRFGAEGFDPALVDDQAPARHYTAFVFVGFWLPRLLSVCVLWGWEILGFIRYGGEWSQEDIRMGMVGIRHGEWVRRYGPTVLPGLIAGELAEQTPPKHTSE